MQYAPYSYNNTLEVSKKISQSSEYINQITLFCILFNIKEIADCLSQYIRLIDYYSLKRVSKNFKSTLSVFGSMYKLSDLANVQLKGESLFDIADKTECVISGSFILRLLLSTPYSMPHWTNCIDEYDQKYEASDIDIYSHAEVVKNCPTCKCSMDHISKISTYLCNGLSQPHGFNNSSHQSRQYNEVKHFFDVWKFTVEGPSNSKFLYNDIILHEYDDIPKFIKTDFDLDFCKNFYRKPSNSNKGILSICCPETVLKMTCSYNKKNRSFNIFERIFKYTNRGFIIQLSGTLLKDYSKYKKARQRQIDKYKKEHCIDTLNNLMNDMDSSVLKELEEQIKQLA